MKYLEWKNGEEKRREEKRMMNRLFCESTNGFKNISLILEEKFSIDEK